MADFDFGFTDDAGFVSLEVEYVVKLKTALNGLYTMFEPLLSKLEAGDGAVIKWPAEERKVQIAAFREKVVAYLDTTMKEFVKVADTAANQKAPVAPKAKKGPTTTSGALSQ